MPKWLTWVGLAGSFVLLASLSQNHHTRPTHWLTGNQLLETHHAPENHETQLVGVRGQVTAVEQRASGSTTIKLQADDGAQVTLVIPPHIIVKLPSVGERVEAQGSQLDLGIITLEAPQLRVTTPAQFPESNPRTAPKFTRIQVRGNLEPVREVSGGTLVNITQDDNYVITAFAPQRLNITTPRYARIVGYRDDKNELVIEGVQTP
jgi:hypothetical protein